jgi:hypothetical protein
MIITFFQKRLSTWQGSKRKSPPCAIFMKVGTLELFLTRNLMEQVLGPKTNPWGVKLCVKGQRGQKLIIEV